MKIAVSVYKDDEETTFRQFNIKPETDRELYEAVTDVMVFLNECYGEMEAEGI